MQKNLFTVEGSALIIEIFHHQHAYGRFKKLFENKFKFSQFSSFPVRPALRSLPREYSSTARTQNSQVLPPFVAEVVEHLRTSGGLEVHQRFCCDRVGQRAHQAIVQPGRTQRTTRRVLLSYSIIQQTTRRCVHRRCTVGSPTAVQRKDDEDFGFRQAEHGEAHRVRSAGADKKFGDSMRRWRRHRRAKRRQQHLRHFRDERHVDDSPRRTIRARRSADNSTDGSDPQKLSDRRHVRRSS